MRIDVGTQVWVVVDDEGKIHGVWNSWYHAKEQAVRLKLKIDTKEDENKHIKVSTYLGGV